MNMTNSALPEHVVSHSPLNCTGDLVSFTVKDAPTFGRKSFPTLHCKEKRRLGEIMISDNCSKSCRNGRRCLCLGLEKTLAASHHLPFRDLWPHIYNV